MRHGYLILTVMLATQSLAQSSTDSILTSLNKHFRLSKFDSPTQIIEFNKDTILVAGYLEDLLSSIPRYDQETNIIYKTTNGGKNWKQLRFSGSGWIYTSCHDRKGNIWMGGSDNYIHYSSDYGDTWERKHEPFLPINRVTSIEMVTPMFGIAGGLHNGLALTYDNWISSKQIPTPLDQKRFSILPNSSRNRINKASIIDSIILINQDDHIYFSSLKTINWKAFNIPVLDFRIDKIKNEIVLESQNGIHFVLSPDLELRRKYQEEIIVWGAIQDDTLKLPTDTFFENGIKSLELWSTKWVFDRVGHAGSIYKPIYEGMISPEKKGVFNFRSDRFGNNDIYFTINDLIHTFSSEQIGFPFSALSQSLSFSELDINNYHEVLSQEKIERSKEKEFGGDPSSRISLDNKLFQEYEEVIQKINPIQLKRIFDETNIPDSYKINEGDKIELLIINRTNDTLRISNAFFGLYSLPWTIQLKGKSRRSYNPHITEFMRSIVPTDFPNYEMLLGGKVIYRLIQERIIDEIEYKKD